MPAPKKQNACPHMNCTERVHVSEDLHPGWVRATAILLRGLERLRARNASEQETTKEKPTVSL